MMKLFLDSNVIVDALVDRGPSHAPAKLILALGRVGEFELWVSPTQWTDLFYILSEGGKRSKSAQVIKALEELRACMRVSTMGESEIDQAMRLNWPDMEDAVVYAAARTTNPDAIITQNERDYSLSELPVYTCEAFFDWINREYGVSYTAIGC